MLIKKVIFSAVLLSSITGILFLSSCSSNNPVTQIFSNEVSAKQRLNSANSQATSQYGSGTKLVLIFGRNVKSDGKTDISVFTAATSPDSIGTWLYVYRVPSDNNLRVYTPDPTPGTSDCIELTAFFNISTIISLIQDTSARNTISTVMNAITSTNVSISTPVDSLIDSDASLSLANTTSPVIKLNESNIPDTNYVNGSVFFSSGSNQSINMFLMPSVSISFLGLPPDLWVVNYKKTDTNNNSLNLVLATVVESNQVIGVPPFSSKVLNLAKD